MEEIISRRQVESWSSCLQKQKRRRIVIIAAAGAVNILLCLFWITDSKQVFTWHESAMPWCERIMPWIHIAVDTAAFCLVYTRYMFTERRLKMKRRLAERLLKQKPESSFGRVVCGAREPVTVRGIPCRILRLETREGMREILAVERPADMKPDDRVHLLTADGYLLAWEQAGNGEREEREKDLSERSLAEETEVPDGRKGSAKTVRKAHLQHTWWVYPLACMAFAAFWLTLSEIWGRPSGRETLHIVTVADVSEEDELCQALEGRFQDSFRSIVVERYSPSDPMLSQRLAIAAADGKDLVVLPVGLLTEDIGDTFFLGLERETAERYFPGREQYIEQDKVYGIKIQNGDFFAHEDTDGGFYLFFTGASENLSALTGSEKGNNAALEVALWLTGGME